MLVYHLLICQMQLPKFFRHNHIFLSWHPLFSEAKKSPLRFPSLHLSHSHTPILTSLFSFSLPLPLSVCSLLHLSSLCFSNPSILVEPWQSCSSSLISYSNSTVSSCKRRLMFSWFLNTFSVWEKHQIRSGCCFISHKHT